jgi:hypothetical protein
MARCRPYNSWIAACSCARAAEALEVTGTISGRVATLTILARDAPAATVVLVQLLPVRPASSSRAVGRPPAAQRGPDRPHERGLEFVQKVLTRRCPAHCAVDGDGSHLGVGLLAKSLAATRKRRTT